MWNSILYIKHCGNFRPGATLRCSDPGPSIVKFCVDGKEAAIERTSICPALPEGLV